MSKNVRTKKCRARNIKSLKMFKLFKKKSEREKLLLLYKKKKNQAFKLSSINRRESDKLEKEANDILIQIDIIDKKAH